MAHAKKQPIQVIQTSKAGPPVGPYSQGIKAGGFIFVAGEKGMDPVTKQIVPGGIEAETQRTLENIKAILRVQRVSCSNESDPPGSKHKTAGVMIGPDH